MVLVIKVSYAAIGVSIDTAQDNNTIFFNSEFDPYTFYLALITLAIGAGEVLIFIYDFNVFIRASCMSIPAPPFLEFGIVI